MLLIIANHYSVYGGWAYAPGVEIHKFYTQALSIGGHIGVNFFVLVPGYFLCKEPFKWDCVINVLAKTWFYALSILIFFLATAPEKVTHDLFIESLLPFGYCFVTAFVGMLILSPFINIIIDNLSKKDHLRLLVLFSVLVTVPFLNEAVGGLCFFIYLYCIGAFVRKYYEEKTVSNKTIFLTSFFCVIAILSSIAVFDYLSLFTELPVCPLYFIQSKTPFVLCLSVLIFIYFKQLNIGSVKSINLMSPAMLGVYLIHENNLIRPFLWLDLLKNKEYLNSEYLYLHSFLSIMAVFAGCVAIELVVSKIARLLKLQSVQEKLSVQIDKGLILLKLI